MTLLHRAVTPRIALVLVFASSSLLPACECAVSTDLGLLDAGDSGARADGSPGRDANADANADANRHDAGPVDAAIGDGGMCANPETCDGTDQDCDGLIDEELAEDE